MILRIFTYCLLLLLGQQTFAQGEHSIAREWNEINLELIRNDFARPTVHARNLFHMGIVMYDAWAAFDTLQQTYLLGQERHGFVCLYDGIELPADIEVARKEAISYAAFRLLSHRFRNSPNTGQTLFEAEVFFTELGYDPEFRDADYTTGNPAALGNYLAEQMILFGLQDGANEQEFYENKFYEPVNPPLIMDNPGNPNMVDPNRWQPLTLEVFIDQSGNQIPGNTPEFLSPEWGQVAPFALQSEDVTIYNRDGFDYYVYYDPGQPPYLNVTDSISWTDDYKWNYALVAIWSAQLDPDDGIMMDISPASLGNIDFTDIPTTAAGMREFYDLYEGGDIGTGHELNPATGEPYAPQMVLRADYARVLAEFWADGPDSETPPGHWFTITNYVSDHPLTQKRFRGVGPVLSDLEWDVKTYLTLGGAMHDSAISAWGIKGYYDYPRPVSAIRYMAELGQSSDSNLPNFHAGGMPLVEDYIELIMEDDPLVGETNEHLHKIKIKAWRGPDFIPSPADTYAGVGWIRAEDWYPYQRPTFVSPPFGGYISGHSVFSRAAAEVLTQITGSRYFPGGMSEFVVEKNEFLVFEDGPSEDFVLQWATYQDASDQTSLSRIWGGIHPPADDIPGRIIGKRIGDQSFAFARAIFSVDADNDGFATDEDCDDTNASINPNAEEIPNNDIDENCDGVALVIDEDNDGFNSDEDCNDTDANVNPNAEEIANNDIDEDCDGVALIIDEDNDGFNSDEDCNDMDATINPDAAEIANNDLDEDCDGEDFVSAIHEWNGQELRIFPNPATDGLNIQLEQREAITVRLYDPMGVELLHRQMTTTNIYLDVSQLPTGVYFVEVSAVTGQRRVVDRIYLVRD